jgi:hypothetical protein
VRLVQWSDIAPLGAEQIQPAWHTGCADDNYIISLRMLILSIYNGDKIVYIAFRGASYVQVARW